MLNSIVKGIANMWFLPKLAGLYMLTPLFIQLVKNKKYTQYYLTLSFAVTIIVGQTASVMQLFSKDGAKLINDNIARLGLGMDRCAFYYVLGYYLSTVKIKRKTMPIVIALGAIGFIATAVGTMLLSLQRDAPLKHC